MHGQIPCDALGALEAASSLRFVVPFFLDEELAAGYVFRISFGYHVTLLMRVLPCLVSLGRGFGWVMSMLMVVPEQGHV